MAVRLSISSSIAAPVTPDAVDVYPPAVPADLEVTLRCDVCRLAQWSNTAAAYRRADATRIVQRGTLGGRRQKARKGKDTKAQQHGVPFRATVVLITVALCALLVGLALLFVLGAPRQLLIVAAMAIGLVVSLLITLVWKISVHTGTVAGSVVILALIFGPAVLTCEVLAATVGWTRVELGDHASAQVVGGGIIGAVTAAAVFALLR